MKLIFWKKNWPGLSKNYFSKNLEAINIIDNGKIDINLQDYVLGKEERGI